ncbi:MAG: hypothetical protein H7175_11790 [Burkholderiales bacterium]|nr:hypothetical protein [Anaerolineae bacterium]
MKLNARNLTLNALLLLAIVGQILSTQILWGHTSASGEVLGVYSKGYAVVLALHIALSLGWIAAFALRKRLKGWLSRPWPRGWVLTISYIPLLLLWLTLFEEVIKQYVALNWLLLALVIVVCAPDERTQWRRWLMGGGIIVLLLLPLVLITVLTIMRFSPDEAQYADMATSPFRVGGLYSRLWMRTPYVIEPGKGWSLAAYGWVLENVWYDIKAGRLWNFVVYLLAIAGIGAIAARLYGRRAAVVSVFIAALSQTFIPVVDYRPNHQLAAAVVLLTFTAIQARLGTKRRGMWHALTGLFATLSMQLHTAGVVFVLGFSVFYVTEFALNIVRRRPVREMLMPLLWFGIGAGIGSAVYYVFNIALSGGLQNYVDFLLTTRGTRLKTFAYLRWPSLIEWVIILAGFAFIAWRRRGADRLFLGILASVLVGVSLMDTQGYTHHYAPLYFVPIGTLIADGFFTRGIVRGTNWRSAAAAACIVVVLAGRMLGSFVAWDNVTVVLQTGTLPPYLYAEMGETLAQAISADDVVVGTHQLLWSFPDHEHLYSASAEGTAMERWGLSDPSAVWERAAPTVIVKVDGQTDVGPGLEDYMARHDFQMCDAFVVQGIAVTVYRESC